MNLKISIIALLFAVAACSGGSDNAGPEDGAVSYASVVEDLTNAIFSDDMPRSVNTYRQNLQLEYVNRLIAIISGESKAQFDYLSQSTALHNLRQIDVALKANRGVDAETRAHRANILFTIERGLDADS